jgi:threonine dehydratase
MRPFVFFAVGSRRVTSGAAERDPKACRVAHCSLQGGRFAALRGTIPRPLAPAVSILRVVVYGHTMTTTHLPISLDDVRAAASRIHGRVHRTPVIRSRSLDERSGRELFFKCENLQRTGSFKSRGATNKLMSLSESERRRGVVAFSSGNHAQAVALAARSLSVDAVIVMPDDAPTAKVEATRSYGAAIVTYDRLREDREEIARRIVDRDGRVLVPPFDDPLVMAGQGTAALELFEEVDSLDAIVTPVGGGGLLSGTAVVARGLGSDIRVFGAEPATANDTALSLAAGERVRIAPPDTIADGARPQSPGVLTFEVMRALVDDVVLVSDALLVDAMRELLSRAKLLVEPTGVLGAAAALYGMLPEDAHRVGVVLSGGNVDLTTLASLLAGRSHED